MKEFYGEPGGRTAFNEDFEALRDLALSFHHVFDDCEKNFVLSGCDVQRTTNLGMERILISEGYVWLGGKIRKVEKTAINSTKTPIYIVPKDTSGTQINYATKGVTGEMYYEYGADVTTKEPSGTNFIAVGFDITKPTVNNTLLNSYILEKNNVDKQVVNSRTSFLNDILASNMILLGNNKTVLVETTNNDTLKIIIQQNELSVLSYEISNGIKCYNSNEKLIFDLSNGPEEQGYSNIFLPNVTSEKIQYDNVKGSYKIDSFYMTDKPFKNIFYQKNPFHDWTPFVWDDGAEIGQLMIKQVGFEYFISGMLPINDEKFKAIKYNYGSDKAIRFKTNIKIPFVISTPTENIDTWLDDYFVVRGENITYKNTCTIWFIKDSHLCYKSYDTEPVVDNNLGIGIPCPSSIFWNFITN